MNTGAQCNARGVHSSNNACVVRRSRAKYSVLSLTDWLTDWLTGWFCLAGWFAGWSIRLLARSATWQLSHLLLTFSYGHTRVSSVCLTDNTGQRLTEKDRKTFEGQRRRTLRTREETRFIRYKPVIVGFRTTSYAFSDTWAAVERAFLTVFYDSNRSIERSALPIPNGQ